MGQIDPQRASREPADERPMVLARARMRSAAVYCVPAAVTVGWLVAVLVADELGRVAEHWESTITMIFGSFLAGSSPEGGGAVAFPIFTKVLEAPAAVARTFSLSIQAVGMTVASIVILLARRTIEWRAFGVAVPLGIAGFFVGLFVLGDSRELFWGFRVSPAYAKVTFTVTLAAMAYLMFVMLRSEDKGADRCPIWNTRVTVGLAGAAFVGGAITSLTGTGVNVMLFLFIVLMAGLHPRVGVPTSILTMASLSIVGFVALSLLHGQFDLGFNSAGEIVSVSDRVAETPLDASRADLFGFWLAAVPVVVWGAPLGTWVVHVLHERRLIMFVGVLASAEVLTTIIFLDDLRSNGALLVYFIGGLVAALVGVRVLRRFRREILGFPPVIS
ncbi:MAG: sulfite exporter TauE/SafE family protein [Gaiellaceae bacterium]